MIQGKRLGVAADRKGGSWVVFTLVVILAPDLSLQKHVSRPRLGPGVDLGLNPPLFWLLGSGHHNCASLPLSLAYLSRLWVLCAEIRPYLLF